MSFNLTVKEDCSSVNAKSLLLTTAASDVVPRQQQTYEVLLCLLTFEVSTKETIYLCQTWYLVRPLQKDLIY